MVSAPSPLTAFFLLLPFCIRDTTQVQRSSSSSSESVRTTLNCGLEANVSMKFLHPPAVRPAIQDPEKRDSCQVMP